jgi:hypothetical protein
LKPEVFHEKILEKNKELEFEELFQPMEGLPSGDELMSLEDMNGVASTIMDNVDLGLKVYFGC